MRYLKVSGEKIKEARRSAGLTQNQLGGKMGVTGSMIGQYETETRHPSIKTANLIAEILGVDVMQLMDEYDGDDSSIASEKKHFIISIKSEYEDLAPFFQAAKDAIAGKDIDAQTLEDLKAMNEALDNDTLLHASSINAHSDVAIRKALKNLDDFILELCRDENAKTDAQKLRELEVMPFRIGQVKDFIKANRQFLKKNMSFPAPADNEKE